jgi:hypothetical protein
MMTSYLNGPSYGGERCYIPGKVLLYSLKSAGYFAGRSWIYSRKKDVIYLEERSYIAEREQLYSEKSAVSFPEECFNIHGRAHLYSRKLIVILPEEFSFNFEWK